MNEEALVTFIHPTNTPRGPPAACPLLKARPRTVNCAQDWKVPASGAYSSLRTINRKHTNENSATSSVFVKEVTRGGGYCTQSQGGSLSEDVRVVLGPKGSETKHTLEESREEDPS